MKASSPGRCQGGPQLKIEPSILQSPCAVTQSDGIEGSGDRRHQKRPNHPPIGGGSAPIPLLPTINSTLPYPPAKISPVAYFAVHPALTIAQTANGALHTDQTLLSSSDREELPGLHIHHDLGHVVEWRVGALQMLQVLQKQVLGHVQTALQAARLQRRRGKYRGGVGMERARGRILPNTPTGDRRHLRDPPCSP